MTPQFELSRFASSVRRVCQGAMAIAVLAAAASLAKAQLIYTEDFNTDGAGTRYTVEGGGFVPKNGQVVPVPAGTSYWGRNTEVIAKGEVVGVPFPAPARRALLIYHHALDSSFLTDDGKKLIAATIKWLTDGKEKMVVMFSAPAGAENPGDQYLISSLTAAGHTVIDDDVATYPVLGDIITAQKVDLIINSSTGGDPIRLSNAAVPLLSFAEALSGDMLLATSGDPVTFDPGDVKIEVPAHPIAAGLPANLKFVTESQLLNTIGLGLPAGSVTVASYQFTNEAGDVSTRPFLVVTEKGVQLLGGLISGMEGGGYWAGADLNEPNVSTPPDDPARTGPQAGRTLTLKEVDVTGKADLKLTFALAGTEVDFDGPGGDDYLSIQVDLNNTGEFIELARYGSPTATEKFLVEMIKGGDGLGGPPDLVKPDYSKRVGIVAKDFTYDIPAGATKLVVRFQALCTFWNEIMAFDNIRIHSGPLAPPVANTGQPAEFGQTVNGFQDDFKGATRDPNWVPRGPGGDLYKQEDGLLRVTVRAGDPNHLLYEAPGYSNNVQEVLARIRITSFGTGDGPRGGIGVGVQTTPAAELSRGINLHFRNFTQDNVPGRQFKLLDDARAWGPPGLKIDWETNQWFWLRLRQDPNAGGGTDDVFSKVWLADGKTAEPADWQLKWNYIPTRTARVGFAGITGSSIDGLSAFEVDYILIKAAGLPEVKVNFDPTGPAPTTPKFTRIQAVGTNIEFEWVGAGTLQQADSAVGPWTNVANAGSPRRVAIGTTTAKFYRLVP